MTGEASNEIPTAAPQEVRHLLLALQGMPVLRQLAALLAAGAWLIDQHWVGEARHTMLSRAVRRMEAHANLLAQQVRGRA